jgi:hypothetical protein
MRQAPKADCLVPLGAVNRDVRDSRTGGVVTKAKKDQRRHQQHRLGMHDTSFKSMTLKAAL